MPDNVQKKDLYFYRFTRSERIEVDELVKSHFSSIEKFDFIRDHQPLSSIIFDIRCIVAFRDPAV
jgi:hypothetical protein